MKTKMCAPNDVVRKVRGVSETGTAILRMCLVKNEMEEKKKMATLGSLYLFLNLQGLKGL